MTETPLYLASYILRTPRENNRQLGVCDYLIAFVTGAVEHPEVIRQTIILDDACERIPHLYQFLESVSDDPPSTISLLDLDRIENDEFATLPPVDYLLSHYCLRKVYGDETSILEIPKVYFPEGYKVTA